MGNTLLTVSMAHRHTDSPGRTGPEPTTQPGKINLSRKLGLALGDEAVTWMNARGNTQQWGTAPWTGNEKREAFIRDHATGGGMRIAQNQDGTVLGVLVITETRQAYVPAAGERELYVNLLLVSRCHSGWGIGAALIEQAKREAAARGIGLIRVDCWAGEDGSLVPGFDSWGSTLVGE
jgi:GNAT superfamily N-acetyltransferase